MRLSKALTTLAAGMAVSAFMTAAAPALAEDLVMWERSGGNAGMVDRLVEMWNEKNPTGRSSSPTSRMPRWWRSSPRPSPPATFPT